jgi:PAS domain S-box-containing protein
VLTWKDESLQVLEGEGKLKESKAIGLRKFGIELVDAVPWGMHLCQFYESKQDLIDILVPYFAEGLRSNEFCMWVTSPPLEVAEATEALRKVVPDLDVYLSRGQIEIISYDEWYLLGGEFDAQRVLKGWVEKEQAALKRGFAGLRLTGNTLWVERSLWKSFVDYEEAVNSVIGEHKMIAVCTYCLTKCTGTDVLDVVRNHIGTLVKQGDKWFLIEDAARRKAANGALKLSEQKYSALFENMQDGFAYHKAVFDEKGKPVDYVFLEVNDAFERLTGLKRKSILGKAVTQVLLGIENDPANWIGVYGKVALTGAPVRFENYAETLNRWFTVSAYSPEKGYFVAIFEDITERKTAEREIDRLAKFPSENPHVVLRFDKDGTTLYSNPTGKFLLKEWKIKIGERAPDRILSLVADAFASKTNLEFEEKYEEETFMFTLAPIVEEDYVNLYGINITERKKAEDALRESEQRWATTLSSIGDAVIATDVKGKITFINAVAEELTGWKLSEAKNKPLEEVFKIVNEQNRSEVENPVNRVLNKGVVVGLANHTILLRKDGTEVPIDDSSAPIRNEYGKITGVVLVFRDISQRKKTEDILREHSSIVISASDAIFSMDTSFVIKTWNLSAEHMFGWKAEEVRGKTAISLFNPKYPTPNGTTRKQAIKELMNNDFWKGEMIYHKKDGSPLPVLVSSSLVKDELGSVTGVVAIAHDITARKRREKVLKGAQHDLNHAQAVGKIGSWRLDIKRNVLLWSDENHRIFGVPKGTPMTYETFLSRVHPDDRKHVDRKWQAGLQGELYDIEHRIIVDGEVKWVREKAELEFDKDGTLLGGFGTTQDITDLVEMREKLEEYSNQMEQLANERAEKLKDAERLAAIGATAGMVGHDIRNPLQAIVGNLYLVKSDLTLLPESEEKQSMKESIDDVAKNVEYINKIVQDLQDYARPLKPAVQETSFEELCTEVLFKNGVPENIAASYQVAKDAQTLMADPSLLKRILNNLTNNAIQAMEQEGGKLEINAYKDKNDFIITVHDTGVGIPEEVKPSIFTPLFTTKSKGQGFGLAVVKRMTEALGGTVTFESKEGTGTTFTVRIPQKTKNKK